jgi:2-dehydro-3-deoxyphosphooctonate aldolase (KDO 8-P synthase)
VTTWILGPCSLESRDLFFSVGLNIAAVMDGRDWYYKASFDKANRSSMNASRGLGFVAGLEVFREFKRAHPHIRLTTDVHECYQVESLADCIDCIQVPAFLCRQTDLLVECGKYFDRINIKKGQWVSPENIVGAVDKVRSANPNAQVWLSERGTQFGYDRLIVDFRTVDDLALVFDKVILDCTHSTQCMRNGGRTGGERGLAEKYLLSASIFGYTGVFAEVHPDPSQAISDGDCQLELAALASLVKRYDAVAAAANVSEPAPTSPT